MSVGDESLFPQRVEDSTFDDEDDDEDEEEYPGIYFYHIFYYI